MENIKKRILLIEDEEMIRSMYSTKLNQDGFEVLLAEDGKVGLEIIEKENFDLILLDIIMPRMDGFLTLKQIRQKEKSKNIPVLMLTNLSTEDDREKGKKLGASGYLVKSSMTPGQISKEILKYFN